MKFISKLYFNTFKRIGNLRFMFVTSCFFVAVSLFCVSFNAYHYVKYINIDKISLEETLNAYIEPAGMFRYGTKLHDFVKLSANKVEVETEYVDEITQMLSNIVIARKYCAENLIQDAYVFGKKHFSEIFDFEKLTTAQDFCNMMTKDFPKSFSTIYTFSYLWNYFWVIFWFYLPFLS
jgi:hypothetical protein